MMGGVGWAPPLNSDLRRFLQGYRARKPRMRGLLNTGYQFVTILVRARRSATSPILPYGLAKIVWSLTQESEMFNRKEMNVPTMTLDLRIEPLVKSVVAKMLLSESDVQDAVEAAVKLAVDNFDWRSQIQKEVEQNIRQQINQQMSQMISEIFWDKEFVDHFRKAVGKAIKGE